ncbi:phosphopantetheine-binding protein [Marinomonas sp. 5E14-1]|uniref:phosphopantetheine-binding protein n=1 Tax=Marinomonas sp. 5E14-1 TaxID=3153922 RepID=UPI0032647ECE
MTNIKLELKNMIIEALELEDITADDIIDSEPLFIDGLGLDSIDALEIGLALQKKYGIKLKADSKETHNHFASINALAELVESYKETH